MTALSAFMPIPPTVRAWFARTTTQISFSGTTLWRPMLDAVYAVVRPRPELGPRWTNVMLYKDDVPHVEVGVLVNAEFAGEGDVVPSQLPGGAVVRTLYRGDWARLGEGHDAVQRFAAEQGLELAGPRWEIYGHEDGGVPETEIYYLVR